MAIQQTSLWPLLALMNEHTVLDYDNNDATLCEVHPKGTFTDMTSNQVSGEGVQGSAGLEDELIKAIVAEELFKPHHQHLMLEAVNEASQLVLDGFEGVKGRDVASVAVDIVTIKLALPILPLLKPTGLVHCQLSLGASSSSLENLLHHAFDPSSRSNEEHYAIPSRARSWGLHGLPGYEVLRVAQKTLKMRGWDAKTKMMAAREEGIVILSEALSLAGLDHSTLSPAVLALLSSTPLTPEIEACITQSLSLYAQAEPTSLECDPNTEKGRQTLADALEREDVKELMRSATEIFGDFKMGLFELAKEKLKAVAEGH
ncbi:BZ3500_MvSof-1268-A1-R1_Chr6-1g08376 [Microbotryum saponariae]|uniref:BZ3500_MvSof-1268-A1-R1_Chr6-1g08376 protein n=1 Tax=Microbotryum saponariae TaxID=289078 RepID=A0A2X0LQ65_9BASI|nr:BZ3500_MvSof-1268-A1-R1_Chr6-1g08376 [Microbotryum saponariae]SDA07660.1 BZ3501_MvSof-1269-A2-R1_Chr6-1g08097 [Microbotryum saponariae]